MAGDESEKEGMLNVKAKKLKDRTVSEGRAVYGREVKEYVRNFESGNERNDHDGAFVKRTVDKTNHFAKVMKMRTE